MSREVDQLHGDALVNVAALAEGVDPAYFDKYALFLREADVMERWGKKYLVHVRMPNKIAGMTNWMPGEGECPLDACMRAFIKKMRSVKAGN